MPVDRRPEYFKGAQLRVGIIGCGYVGLPLGLRFAEAGHRVTGFDTDPAKVEKLNRGQTYIQHIPQSKIQQFVQSKHFGATADFSRLAEMDAILICVPTPLDQRRERSGRICSEGSWWSWNRRRIQAQPKNWCCRSWNRRA